jgi:hypothetical protein
MSDDEDSLGYNTGDDEAGKVDYEYRKADSPYTAFSNSERGIASDSNCSSSLGNHEKEVWRISFSGATWKQKWLTDYPHRPRDRPSVWASDGRSR